MVTQIFLWNIVFNEDDGSIRWVQKTILMTQIVVYDEETMSEIPTVYADIALTGYIAKT